MASRTRAGRQARGSPGLDTLLHALRGDDALAILRRLADRDPESARVIEALAKEALSAIDAGEVAAQVLVDLESLRVEDAWDRAGPGRGGYSDPGEVAAEMIDEALEPHVEEVERLIGLGLQLQADGLFRGVLRGLYDFGTAPATPFRDEAADPVEDRFGADLLDWRNRLPGLASHLRLDDFLVQFCSKWADWAILKDEGRIEALFTLYAIAPLVQALIERELRRAMAREGIPELPIFSEQRQCAHPTTEQVLRLFSPAERHRLMQRERTVHSCWRYTGSRSTMIERNSTPSARACDRLLRPSVVGTWRSSSSSSPRQRTK